MIALTINGQTQNVEVDPDTPLLWALREQVGSTGTKRFYALAPNVVDALKIIKPENAL